jgi:hypothetical protein
MLENQLVILSQRPEEISKSSILENDDGKKAVRKFTILYGRGEEGRSRT